MSKTLSQNYENRLKEEWTFQLQSASAKTWQYKVLAVGLAPAVIIYLDFVFLVKPIMSAETKFLFFLICTFL